MKGIKKILFILNLVLVLAVVNYSIWQKEDTLQNGKLVLLKLRPLDPRSLMQGDYMRLRYEMTNQWFSKDTIATRGYCIVQMDSNNVYQYQRLQQNILPLAQDEVALKYYRNDYQVKIGAESFLFEEGQADNYAKAVYGGLRVADNGDAVLKGLYDEDANKIINHYAIE